jgi:osmotically-inducible protein OsmY
VDAVAYLSGNVRTPQAKAYVHAAAASVPGVTAVDGAVVDDHQLEIDVGRVLDVARLFRHGRIYVRSALGDVTLGGFVRSEAAIPDIVKTVAAVPGVRSVTGSIEVEESSPSMAAPPALAAADQDAPQT